MNNVNIAPTFESIIADLRSLSRLSPMSNSVVDNLVAVITEEYDSVQRAQSPRSACVNNSPIDMVKTLGTVARDLIKNQEREAEAYQKHKQAYHEVVDRAEKAESDVGKLLTLLNRACGIIQKIPTSGSVRLSTALDNEAIEFLETVQTAGELVVTLEKGGKLADGSAQIAMATQMDMDIKAIQRAGIKVKIKA